MAIDMVMAIILIKIITNISASLLTISIKDKVESFLMMGPSSKEASIKDISMEKVISLIEIKKLS